jgi:hypothetical protein
VGRPRRRGRPGPPCCAPRGPGVHRSADLPNKAKQSGIFDLNDIVGGNTYDSNSFGTIDPDGFQP